MSAYFEDTSSGALGGAGSGAMLGTMIGGPGMGTAIGAGAGALIGGATGWFRGRSNKKAQDAQKKAREKLAQLKREAYAQRMDNLQRTMAYFQPANDMAARLYGGNSSYFSGGGG